MAVQMRFFAGFCFLLCVVCGFYWARAEPPKDLPLPDLDIPLVPAPAPGSQQEARDQAAFEAIRAAAQGKASDQVSDPILGDVMQAIARRHRELDLELDREENEVIGSGYVGPASKDRFGSSVSRKARAAEQLLKASRLLESVATAGHQEGSEALGRANLVNRMRAEAVKLLTE